MGPAGCATRRISTGRSAGAHGLITSEVKPARSIIPRSRSSAHLVSAMTGACAVRSSAFDASQQLEPFGVNLATEVDSPCGSTALAQVDVDSGLRVSECDELPLRGLR